jgi:hypothetical protein
MGLLDIFRSAKATVTPPPPRRARGIVPGDGSYAIACVGESNYTPALLHAAGVTRASQEPIEEYVEVRLVREPDNRYDPNAVAVVSAHGRKIAYLCREDAIEYGPAVEAVVREQGEMWCNARIGGRRDNGSSRWIVGIWLDLE